MKKMNDHNMAAYNAYIRLHNGDKKYLDIFEALIAFNVTKGEDMKECKLFLDRANNTTRFIIYISLLALTTVLLFFVGLMLDGILGGLLKGAGIATLLYTLYQSYNLYLYRNETNIYYQVQAFVNTCDKKELADIYMEHREKYLQKQQRKR